MVMMKVLCREVMVQDTQRSASMIRLISSPRRLTSAKFSSFTA